MIKATIQVGARSTIEANGALKEIIGDTLAIINGIYTQLSASDKMSGVAYRAAILTLLEKPEVWKPQGESVGFAMVTPEKDDSEEG